LPAEARAVEVACPVCRHQARGSAFPVEAPLPVLLVADTEPRTHLLLDLPVDDSDERDPATAFIGAALVDTAARPLGATQARVDLDARTHLLLSPSEVNDDDATGAASGDPRTRLLRGPLSPGSERKTPLATGATQLGRLVPPLLGLSRALDEALHGRWAWALAALAVACGFVAPTLDYLSSDGRSTLSMFTFTCALVGCGLLLVALLHQLRNDAGEWQPKLAVSRVKTAAEQLIESFEQRAKSPRYLQWLLVGQALSLVGLAGLAWAGWLSGVRLLFGLGGSPSSLPFVSGLFLLAGVGVASYGARAAPALKFSLQESGDSLAAVADLPPIMDLSEPLPEAFRSGTTTLHRTLIALSQWSPRHWPGEAAYRAALERHLQRHLPDRRIERERWVGRSRREGVIDLVVDGMVVIGVKHGFHDECAERAIAQMAGYARAWSGKPMILAIFEAPSAAVMASSRADALVDLHNEFALLSVRMPAQG